MEKKLETYDGNGNLLSVVDNRTLAGEKARRIADLKAVAGDRILSAYPMYKQQNAALGLYSADECQQIKDGIQAFRADCDALEVAINACKTLAELDAI
jgi:hypothetical protein